MNSSPKPGVGIGVMILKDHKVLLGQRHFGPSKADSEPHGEGAWTILEFGESFETAAYREVWEETGLKINQEKIKLVSLCNDRVPDAHFITIGFACEAFDGDPQVMEPDEIVSWQWFPLDNLPQPIFFPSQEIIDNYQAGKIYSQNL
ncbi:MAG: nucleotide triphosphate diphosphatase NUDT15 [Patescibacteria group bacterium]|jgi:8-oxo-dGTP diphosphatase